MTSSGQRRRRRSVNQQSYKDISQSTGSDKPDLTCQEPAYVQYMTCGNSVALDFGPNISNPSDLCPTYRQQLGNSTCPEYVCTSVEYYTTHVCRTCRSWDTNIRANLEVRGHVTTKHVRGQYHVQCTVLQLVTLVSAAEIGRQIIYSFIV
jgi:hypothetical protein